MTVVRGRFAPSPTGPLHAGSLVAALASWLDVRARGGQWLVRIEDVDTPRCVPGVDRFILQQLDACGLRSDAPVRWQSTRHAFYLQALERLAQDGLAYPCSCSRKAIEAAWAARGQPRARHRAAVYPGTCRPPTPRSWTVSEQPGELGRAWRLRLPDGPCEWAWSDRRLGPQQQAVATEVGDFVLRRADGLWAYQLAVVVDDADQGITDVVRGEDLADNTPRQILLQRALGLPTPRHLHTPLVRDAQGDKLSKQTGAAALDLRSPCEALGAAARVLGLGPARASVEESLRAWVAQWRALWPD